MSGTFNIPKRDTHTRSSPGTIIEKRSLLAKDNHDGLSLKADIEHALALNNQKISERIQTQKNSKRTINNFQLPTLHGFDKTMESPVSHQILAPHEEERHLRFLVKTMSSSSSKSPKSGGYMSKGSMPVSIRNSAKGQLPLTKKTSAVVESSPKLSSREQFDTVPDKLFESERRLIANMKLEQDRILTQSRSGTKRNVSYAHDSLHRLPSSQSYDRGELFGLHNSVGPMNGPTSGPMSPLMSKTSIDKLKGHIGEVGNTMGQMRTFAFNLQHANSQVQPPESPEYGRSATLYMNTGTGNNNEDRKVHSNIFNEHFLQSFNKQKTLDKDFVAGYSFEKGFKVKKAFEVGTKKGAEIPRLWTSNSPIKPTTPTPNTASPQRVGTSSGNRMLTMPFTVRDGTGPSLLRKDTVTKEVKEDSPLIAELKKEVPNMFSGAPASRQDVVTMASWVDEKVNSINKTGENESEKYKKCEEVYNICLNELLRQVSLDCLERGELMYKLWMSYYKIFAQFKVNLEAEHEKMKEEVKRDSQKLYDYYDELSRKKENEVEKLKAEIEELVKEKEETDKKMTKIVEKDTRHRDKINKLVNILTQMTTQVQDLTNENDLFKKRYGKKTDFGTKVGKKNQVLIEAGSPKNSEQPRPLFIPLDEDGKARKSKEPAKEPVGFGDNEEIDSDESKESSIDFIYEDIDHNQHVHRMKLLNADNSADGTPGKRGKYNEAETQTHLFLMSSKYDEVFEIQQILDEIIEEFKMRQEFDGIFETLNITDEEGLSANVMQERIYDQVYAGGKKNSIDAMLLDMQKLDPNHKSEDKPSIFKLSRFGQQSRKDSQRLLKLRKEGGMLPDHVMTQDQELAESEVHDVNDGQFSEAIGMLRDTLRGDHSDKGSSLSPQSLQSREVRGSINTQHEGFGRRESQINGPSLGNLSDSVISKDQDDVGHTHATGTDDFTMGTLVDDNTIAQSGQEQGDKMQVIQEAPEEEMGSPSVYRRNKSSSANQSVITQTNEDGSKSDFVLKKNTSKGTPDLHAKLDRHNISDQAKLLLMTRLYRVMLDKNKSLNAGTTEMHEQILNEKENSKKLEETISELKDQLKAYKIGRCPNCATSGGSKEHGNKTDRSNRSLGEDATPTIELDDDIDLDDDEDDNDSVNGGTTTKVDKKGKQRKNYHNRATVAPNADANKKRQKETKDFAANAIIEKVKNKKVSKFKNFLPVKSICKQINSFYMERMNNAKENPSVKEESLVSFVYNWYTHAFGFKKIAEQKFIIFVLSVKKYLHFVRVNLFARFMNLLDGQSNFTLDEFNKYLEGLEILSNSHLGISINNSETDSKHYTPFLRGLEYVKFFSENKMPVEEYIEFKKEFDSLKENDPKNLNRNGIIDIDRLFSKVLVKYRAICNRTKQFVVNAFKAADLDGNKYCSLKEFITIYKNIESEKYDYDFVESLFSEHADVRIEGSINLSFDKFTVVCVEFGLFSDQQQDLFIGVNGHSELVQSMEKLQLNWPMLYLELKEQLETVGKYSEEEEKYWAEILDILQDRISNFQNMDSTDFKPIMIAYKILSRELTDLIDKYAETDGYGVKKIKKTANDL